MSNRTRSGSKQASRLHLIAAAVVALAAVIGILVAVFAPSSADQEKTKPSVAQVKPGVPFAQPEDGSCKILGETQDSEIYVRNDSTREYTLWAATLGTLNGKTEYEVGQFIIQGRPADVPVGKWIARMYLAGGQVSMVISGSCSLTDIQDLFLQRDGVGHRINVRPEVRDPIAQRYE